MTVQGPFQNPKLFSHAQAHLYFSMAFSDIIDDCGTELTGENGWFGPLVNAETDQYYNRLNCTWTITAETGQTIDVAFLYIDMEVDGQNGCSYDFLQVLSLRKLAHSILVQSFLFSFF